jgi:hypothetical protein
MLMLTTFYVDNGPRLPLRQFRRDIAFWFLPAAVGTQMVIRTLPPNMFRPATPVKESIS